MNNPKLKSSKTGFKGKTNFFNWLFSKDEYKEYIERNQMQVKTLNDKLKK